MQPYLTNYMCKKVWSRAFEKYLMGLWEPFPLHEEGIQDAVSPHYVMVGMEHQPGCSIHWINTARSHLRWHGDIFNMLRGYGEYDERDEIPIDEIEEKAFNIMQSRGVDLDMLS